VQCRTQVNQAALINLNQTATRPIEIDNDEYEHDDQ
jgi:hypothetical protein